MQPHIQSKEINVCLCVEDALKTVSLRTKNGIVTNKKFWKTMKLFLTNEGT